MLGIMLSVLVVSIMNYDPALFLAIDVIVYLSKRLLFYYLFKTVQKDFFL